MRVSYRALASAGLMLLLVTVPLAAQAYRGALGFYGGGSWFSDLTPDAPEELRLATSWLAGIQLERWLGSGRVGVRIGGDYAERPLDIGDGSDFNLYSADLAVLFRLLPPDTRRVVAPYFAVGGGALHVNSGLGPSLAANYYQDPVTRPMATLGLGADLFAGSSAGLQLEVADRILIESPFGPPTAGSVRPVHQAVLRLGFQLRFGQQAPTAPVLAYAPQNREEEAPRPEPAPTAEPPVVETVATPEPEPVPEPAASRPTTTLDSVAAAVEVNTAELARLRAQVTDIGRTLDQRGASAASGVAMRTTASRLYTVQVGAYREANMARQLANRMRRSRVPVWVSQVALNGRTYYRVRLGALPSRSDAIRLAQQLRRDYAVQVWVAPIARSDNPPPNAVPATRAVLNGS